MGKVKELSITMDEIIEAGDRMIASYKETITAAEIILNAVKELKGLFSSATPAAAPVQEEPKKVETPAPKQEVKTYTKEDVRGILAAKSSAGKRNEVKALLQKYGAAQLGQLDPKHYAAIVADAEALDG